MDLVKYLVDYAAKVAGNIADQASEVPVIKEALQESGTDAAKKKAQEQQAEPQQQVYSAPVAKAVDRSVGKSPEQHEVASVISEEDKLLTPEERFQREQEEANQRLIDQQKQSLRPSVVAEDSQNRSLDQIQDDFQKWQQEYDERGGNDRIGGEIQRRFTDMDTGELANPLDWNLLGFTSQQTTPKAAKDLYDYYFDQVDRNGAPENKVERTWGKTGNETPSIPLAVDGGIYGPQTVDLGTMIDDWYSQPVVDANAIDNGESPESRESLYMTGEQYKRYIDLGLPGRDPDDIVDDAIYSKQDEQENHGFIPYLTEEGLQRFHDDAGMNMVNNVFNNIADLRRDNTDYSFNYEGNTYSGKDYVDRYNKWVNPVIDALNTSEFKDAATDEYSVPYTWVLHDSVTGEDIPAPTNGDMAWDPETGQPMIDFHTGNPDDNWYFDDEDDFKRSIGRAVAQEGQPVFEYQDIEPLTLSDGQKVRADKAIDLYNNQEIYADYGPGNLYKPRAGASIEDILNPNLEENEFLPWIVDTALGSAPLFFGPTAASQAIGNTYQNMQGFRAGQQGDDGTYNLLSEDPTREQQLVTSAGSAILPLTERLWGIAGRGAKSPIENLVRRRSPNIAEHPLFIGANNALGEAVEEIPGNLVEEMQNAGSIGGGDYFADDLYYYLDDDGNRVYTTLEENPETGEKYIPAYDEQGKRLKDRDTDFFGRVGNFGEEIPISLLGGGILGGVLSTPEMLAARGPYNRRRAEREQLGYNMVIPQQARDYMAMQRQQAGE